MGHVLMTTPLHSIPELTAVRGNEEVANEMFRLVEAGSCFFAFNSRTTGAQPASPSEGDCYIIGPFGVSGDVWGGHEGEIAKYVNGRWIILEPKVGFAGYVADTDEAVVYDGSGWILLFGGTPTDPNWANVSLLLNSGTVDTGALTNPFTDDSNNNHTLAKTNLFGWGPYADTSERKFAPASADCGYEPDQSRLSRSDDASFEFGSGDFTIECIAQFRVLSGNQVLFGYYNRDSDRSWQLTYTSAGALKVFLSEDGTSFIDPVPYTWTPNLDEWYHLAADYDGTTYRLYVNGAVVASDTASYTLFAPTNTRAFHIGCGYDGSTTEFHFEGRIEEVRITKGVARYAGAFNPPTAAFPRS